MKKDDLLKIDKKERVADDVDKKHLYKWIKIAYKMNRTSVSWPGGVPKSSWLIRELEENGYNVCQDKIFGLIIDWS